MTMQEKTLSFEQMPELIQNLVERIEALEKTFREKQQPQPLEGELMSVEDVCKLLGKPKKKGPVFPDLTEYKLSFHIPRLLKLAKIEKHITFHCLRHSIPYFLLKTNDLQNLNLRQVTI